MKKKRNKAERTLLLFLALCMFMRNFIAISQFIQYKKDVEWWFPRSVLHKLKIEESNCSRQGAHTAGARLKRESLPPSWEPISCSAGDLHNNIHTALILSLSLYASRKDSTTQKSNDRITTTKTKQYMHVLGSKF